MAEKRVVYLSEKELEWLAEISHECGRSTGEVYLARELAKLVFQGDLERGEQFKRRDRICPVFVVDLYELEEVVHEALSNAYDSVADMPGIEEECNSLVDKCAELEDRDPRELLEYVRSWVARHG